ncbi:MAG: DUF262 domain-containing protein [Bacteroidales bacterium]|nr:DUF262 domain-containing protein [Bacteroidales bacterium]MBN2750894.1 DUF262 domain-containing protein [Bacteroidales bacterium]
MIKRKKSRFSEEKQAKIIEQFSQKSKLYEYRTKDYAFEVILSKYGEEDDENATLYVPDYQREFVWKNDKKSKFIESVLLGMPLTPFLVSEDEKRRLEIIDGSQRIRTLISFYKDEFSLRKLEKLSELDGARFKDLPVNLQRYLENQDFRIIVVDDASETIRQDIFERINTTSEGLTDSEIRKGSFSGPFYDLVLELRQNKEFRTICPVSDDREKRGEYEELVLRFLAYSDKYLEFKHDVAKFLNIYLESKNLSDFNAEIYRKRFNDMVSFIKMYFPLGFRKEENSSSTPRVRFEAISVGTYLALKENPNLTEPNLEWLNSEGFKVQTTSDSSNNPNRLKERVEFVRDGLLGKLEVERLANG